MKTQNRCISGIIIFLLLLLNTNLFSKEKKLLTVAESSEYTATSKYADVMEFIMELQKQSQNIGVETLCISAEGRKVPLLIIGNPIPSSPLDIRYDKRGVVYIQANIHAGEVEGKEACLMLARDILLKDNSPLFENLVILIAPIFNADGNERISTKNRTRQKGPKNGVGVRYNGQNLDLNRDAMKLESPEVQGLVQNVLNRWDPFLLVDCHTTNGSYHEEPVTYIWGYNPNGDQNILKYMRENMMPEIQQNLYEQHNVLSIPYGNFIDYRNPEKGWRSSGPQPRYITNYISLRNRLAILDENYSYSDYETRVWGCYYFLRSILEYCHVHKDTILKLVENADHKTIHRGLNPSPADSFAVEYDVRPLEQKVTILGYEMEVTQRENARPLVKKTDTKKIYNVPYFCDFFPKRSVRFPFGYLVPCSSNDIIEKLIQHGILVEKLTAPVTLEVECFKLKEFKSAERLFQGHHMNSVKGEYTLETMEFPTGTYFISTAQPLANVAAYLLEPESDDGLLVWNYFDNHLVTQWRRTLQTYPVFKLLGPMSLVKESVR